ncbi:hypothetical protein EIN_340760 [Entamoeba invadens IP1]|uniref:Uncharacterized protein n=2 Tax=Entamoeba invadens TaxID=33085 RepID=A0A0A1UGB5_ENTIV|nr:hypothetical protein EIN_340760 [Entamoeba invadens IP1]BAN40212.1 hypothetical protein [Entamoeba invadens]ELP94738.1 hypothetical protein EIN_340760 [Entamoeba invadens IP1]BAN40507.1 hypothetical protein [Entamoeba invadens]BAN40672.1 hypothetical protein [Entamoeba invadens]BAN40680.1 hypothetical protein [Entamoeba invadens]|eukprot:XP_004261509.1 hypothetical protein EIN_340760 [Entamoeba invadens IP1]
MATTTDFQIESMTSCAHHLVNCDGYSYSAPMNVVIYDKPKKTEKRKRASEDAFKKMRNYQVYQEAVFIALLSTFFEIVVRAPVKKSIVSLQLLRVEVIRSLRDVINVNDFVISRCKEKYKLDIKDGLLEKTAKRRTDTNRVSELLHFLQDVLRELGFGFVSKVTDGKNGAQVVETVYGIFGNGIELDQKDIIEKGKKINDFLNKRLGGMANLVLEKENEQLRNFIWGNN